jgi:hypothetical protein
MRTTNRRARCARLGLALGAVAVVALGLGTAARADDKTQTIDAGGLTFQVPAAWKSTKPQSQMRRAQLTIEPVEGDKARAELVVFAFPGGAGSVDANVERWQRTFKDKDGNPPKADVKTVKGKNCELNRVEITGDYHPTTFSGQAQQPDVENARLLGAIVLTEKTGFFLRLVGPEKTVAAARPAFDTMLGTMKVDN